MTYQEARKYIDFVQKRGSVLGLSPIKALLQRLGNPQNQLKVIHVAGTNGKGSICTFLDGMLRAEGKRVGRYISPTIKDYLERFQINGEYMEPDVFASLMTKIMPCLRDMEQKGEALPTAFEMETVISFLFFLEQQVDVVILETGMGGRLDATNVVEHPLCVVFGAIGMDHMQFLGNSLEEITREKAGIMKKGCPVVSYPNTPEVEEILREEFEIRRMGTNATLHIVDSQDVLVVSESLEESVFSYKGEEYVIQMAGHYQIYNAVTAILVKQVIDGHVDKKGLHNASWEGRFEVVSKSPLLIRDGAHNLQGVMALKESVEKHFTNRPLIFIIGVLRDKEYDKMMACLCPLADKIFTVTTPGERGLPAKELWQCIMPYCKNVVACQNVEHALLLAKQEWKAGRQGDGREPVIIAWGSLSYLGQIAKV